MACQYLIIGAQRKISRRRAKKLAYQFRGGRRAQWYAQYLAGDTAGFIVAGHRLVRMPQLGKPRIVTIHMTSAAEALGRMTRHLGAAAPTCR